MPRSRRQLLNGWNAAQGWRSSPQERTGVIQRIVIFWKEIKRLNLSEHSEKKTRKLLISQIPAVLSGNSLCFMDFFLSKALPFIRELGGGGEDGRVHSEKKDKE
jgi:hypothetical protein